MNFRYNEIVSLLDQGSFVKFYKADELYKLDKLRKYELVATDSMNVLAKIASGKVYLLKYKVDVPDYQKYICKWSIHVILFLLQRIAIGSVILIHLIFYPIEAGEHD